MPVITLTTDWGTTDYFAGALKGEIISVVADATLVDISHHIGKHDQVHGAFVLKNAWNRFPEGSVHISGVKGSGEEQPALLAVKFMNHFFLGPDDGWFSLLFDDEAMEGYYVKNAKGEKVNTSTKMLAASAGFLARGGKISDMGDPVTQFVKKSMLQASIHEDSIRGSVIYIDSFGNLITNITKELFDRIGRGRDFEIVLKKSGYEITTIQTNYYEIGSGNLMAHHNEAGYIEIAISKGSARDLLNMKYGEIVRIDFK